jgi:hypothetical protein
MSICFVFNEHSAHLGTIALEYTATANTFIILPFTIIEIKVFVIVNSSAVSAVVFYVTFVVLSVCE